MKIMVTGGAGFIGSFIVRELLELGHEVVVYDAFIHYFSPLESNYDENLRRRFEGIEEKFRIVRGDTRNETEVRRCIWEHRPQRIIHDNGEAPLAPQCSVTNGYTAPAVFEVCVTYPPPRRGVWAANAPFRDAAIVGATREVSRAVTGIRYTPPGEQLSVKRLHRSAPASHP